MLKNIFLCCALVATPSFAASNNNDIAVEGYLMALNSMAPSRAKFTVMQKDFIETTCATKLTVSDLNSNGFQNIVMALETSEYMATHGIESEGLNSVVMTSVMSNTDCDNFSATFENVVNDKHINEMYPKFSKFMHTWYEVSSAKQ